MKPITTTLIKKILTLRKKKVPLREIQNKLNLSRTTICKYSENMVVNGCKNKGGRPRKLSDVAEKSIIDGFKSNKFKFLRDGKEDLVKNHDISITRQSIKNYLNRAGVLCYIKQKKPLLSDIHKFKRYNFSIQYLNFGYFEWSNVIWSDESTYALYNTNKKEYYWKNQGEAVLDSHVKKTVKFGGISIMVWGCLTSFGVGELLLIDGTVNSEKYIDILQNGLVKTIDFYRINHKKAIFMQDNATPHKAKNTMEWLKRNKIKVMDWPAQSPDLNPIENVWEIIDKRLRKKEVMPKNRQELFEAVKEEWYKIDETLIRNLYMSMIRRILQLNEARGGYTKY